MKKDSGVTAWKVASIILLALLIGSIIYFTSQTKDEQCEVCLNNTQNKAILDVEIYDWAENLYDSSEMFFDYWIYNYGNNEAKNIKVRCKLFDKYDNVRASVVDYYGNLASASVEFGEVITSNFKSNSQEEFSATCYIESCDNCEILYKRIPELVEGYKEN